MRIPTHELTGVELKGALILIQVLSIHLSSANGFQRTLRSPTEVAAALTKSGANGRPKQLVTRMRTVSMLGEAARPGSFQTYRAKNLIFGVSGCCL